MGGAVALTLAMDAPDRVAGLFLVGTGARLRVAPAILEGSADPARAMETAEAMAAFSFGSRASAEDRAAHVRAVAAQPAGVLHDDFAACDAFDAMARLGSIRAPAFVVVGEEDRLTPPKYAAFLRERLPGDGMLLVRGAGHMVATEAPAEVAAAVAAFLDRVSP
jgi:pimeloyl-ACP methyl ester carboxylesterase